MSTFIIDALGLENQEALDHYDDDHCKAGCMDGMQNSYFLADVAAVFQSIMELLTCVPVHEKDITVCRAHEVGQFMIQLTKCNGALVLALAFSFSSAVSAVEAKNHGNNFQVQQIVLNNFAITQQRIRGQISSNVANGRLAPQQAAALTSQLDQIAYRTPAAAADPMQAQLFVNQFSAIDSQLNSSLAPPGTYRYMGAPYNAQLNRNGGYGRGYGQFRNNGGGWNAPAPPNSGWAGRSNRWD